MRWLIPIILLVFLNLASAVCEDEDGVDYFTNASANDTLVTITDSCKLEGELVKSCSGTKCYISEAICENGIAVYDDYLCIDGCSKGVCKESIVILATSNVDLNADYDILFEISKHLQNKGYEIDYSDITYFRNVQAKFESKVIVAVKHRNVVLFVKGSLPESFQKLGDVIDSFLVTEKIPFVRETSIGVNDLDVLFNFCQNDFECEDNDISTIDTCSGDPPICINAEISSCTSGDGFCAKGCTHENDNDCQQCEKDSECDDTNVGTIDTCGGTPSRCVNTPIIECISNDDFCPENCTFRIDEDCGECILDEECLDSNPCTETYCDEDRLCITEKSIGCPHGETCYKIGYQLGLVYCEDDSLFQPLLEEGDYCQEHYQCKTQVCNIDECDQPMMLTRILGWFKRLFT